MKDKSQNIFSVGRTESSIERLAIGSTRYIGSPASLVIHTIFFISVFGLQKIGFSFEKTMLVLTTVVSLEAIYLSLFIQMTVNRQARQIEEVSEDIDDIQEDVEGISKDVDDIQEDVDDIQEDVQEISKDIDEMLEDVDSIQEHTEEINADMEGIHEHIEHIKENVEDLSEELDREDFEETIDDNKVSKIEHVLEELLAEVKALKKDKTS